MRDLLSRVYLYPTQLCHYLLKGPNMSLFVFKGLRYKFEVRSHLNAVYDKPNFTGTKPVRASGAEAGLGRAADGEAPVPVDRYHPCGGLVREAHSLFVLPAVRLKYGYGIKSSKEEDEAPVPVD